MAQRATKDRPSGACLFHPSPPPSELASTDGHHKHRRHSGDYNKHNKPGSGYGYHSDNPNAGTVNVTDPFLGYFTVLFGLPNAGVFNTTSGKNEEAAVQDSVLHQASVGRCDIQ